MINAFHLGPHHECRNYNMHLQDVFRNAFCILVGVGGDKSRQTDKMNVVTGHFCSGTSKLCVLLVRDLYECTMGDIDNSTRPHCMQAICVNTVRSLEAFYDNRFPLRPFLFWKQIFRIDSHVGFWRYTEDRTSKLAAIFCFWLSMKIWFFCFSIYSSCISENNEQ